MKRFLLLLVCLIPAAAWAGSGRIKCQNLSVSQQILAANSKRTAWFITTTAGTGNIYWSYTNPAVVQGTSSVQLAAQGAFNNDSPDNGNYTGAVFAISASGTAWTCIVEHTWN